MARAYPQGDLLAIIVTAYNRLEADARSRLVESFELPGACLKLQLSFQTTVTLLAARALFSDADVRVALAIHGLRCSVVHDATPTRVCRSAAVRLIDSELKPYVSPAAERLASRGDLAGCMELVLTDAARALGLDPAQPAPRRTASARLTHLRTAAPARGTRSIGLM